MLSNNLLEILRCPESNSKLIQVDNQLISTDPQCRRSYSIIDGTPILLIEKSEVLDIETWEKLVVKFSEK